MTVTLSGCPGGIQFINQPPTELNCDPMGHLIVLICTIQQDNGFSNVTWYWSRCDQDAGVNGTAILPEDRTDAYGIQQTHAMGFSNLTSSLLVLQVSNTTLGYYWCEVNSASSRPSVISPVLQRPIHHYLCVLSLQILTKTLIIKTLVQNVLLGAHPLSTLVYNYHHFALQ